MNEPTTELENVREKTERIGRVMRGLKGEILSEEQRVDRSKAWKQAIAGGKFIYHDEH